MTIAEYLRRKNILHNTTFVINKQGGFYLVDGALIPVKEFEKQYELPRALVNARGKLLNEKAGENIDTRNNWQN